MISVIGVSGRYVVVDGGVRGEEVSTKAIGESTYTSAEVSRSVRCLRPSRACQQDGGEIFARVSIDIKIAIGDDNCVDALLTEENRQVRRRKANQMDNLFPFSVRTKLSGDMDIVLDRTSLRPEPGPLGIQGAVWDIGTSTPTMYQVVPENG